MSPREITDEEGASLAQAKHQVGVHTREKPELRTFQRWVRLPTNESLSAPKCASLLAESVRREVPEWDNFTRNPAIDALPVFIALDNFLDEARIQWEPKPQVWEQAWDERTRYHMFATALVGYIFASEIRNKFSRRETEEKTIAEKIDPLLVTLTAFVHELGRVFSHHRLRHDTIGRHFVQKLGLSEYFPYNYEGQIAYSGFLGEPPRLTENPNAILFVLADQFGKVTPTGEIENPISLEAQIDKERKSYGKGLNPLQYPDTFILAYGQRISDNYVRYLEQVLKAIIDIDFDPITQTNQIRTVLADTGIPLKKWVEPANRKVFEDRLLT